MLDDPLCLSIKHISERIREGEISPVEIVEKSMERIKEMDAILNAFVTFHPEMARRAAKEAEAEIKSGKYRGPLHGVPIGIKDIIDTEGIITTQGSKIFKDNVPKLDATVVTRLKKAGAIIIGKTNTHEFAMGVTTNNPHYGSTRNPWDVELIPGGSSGGSAAATAAHLCFAALGSDTGGSIRIPAAFCGLVGLKPTYGRVSLHGVYPLATVLDHIGPLTRTAWDAAILLQHLAGFDEMDPRSLMEPVPNYLKDLGESTIESLKIGIPVELDVIPLNAEIRGVLKASAQMIESLGGEVIDVKFDMGDRIEKTSMPIFNAEAASQHDELLKQHSSKYGSDVLNRLRKAQKITAIEYVRALRSREEIIRELEILFQEVDFLLSPSVQILPPKIGQEKVVLDSRELDVISSCTKFTRLANLTGMPAIVVPFGYSSDSLPLSIQFMAPKLSEADLLKLAIKLEEATPNLRNKSPTFN